MRDRQMVCAVGASLPGLVDLRRFVREAFLLTLIGIACSPGSLPTGDDPVEGLPADILPQDIQEGSSIFHGFGNCFQCHGADGVGTSNAPSLLAGPWLHVDGSFDEIVALITTGVPEPRQFPGFMPARGGADLSEIQVRRVAAYVFTISREKQAPQDFSASITP